MSDIIKLGCIGLYILFCSISWIVVTHWNRVYEAVLTCIGHFQSIQTDVCSSPEPKAHR